MNRKSNGLAVLIIALILGPTASGASPRVIKATPDNGSVGVDPTLTEIRIKFDQPMGDGMSVVGGGENFPEIVGRPNWADERTFVIRVKLKPNHEFRLSINSDRFQNFKNRGGEAAVPYPIQFRTGAGGAKSAGAGAESKENRGAFELLRTAVRNNYSYRDRLSIDWDKLFASAEAALVAAKSPEEFARLAAISLAKAKDKHIWLQIGAETIPTYVNPSAVNANYANLSKLVPNLKKHGAALAAGRWPDGIGYIAIASWDANKLGDGAEMLELLKGMSDTSALIVDVRPNGGGAEPLAQKFAGCFVSEPRLYGKHVYRDASAPGGFTEPKERWLKPNTSYPVYKERVAVLSGPAVMSSCESFLLMMKHGPAATIVGAKSQGSSGNPKPHDLGNGVTVFLPSWKDLTADGRELEGIGITPDVEVNASASEFKDTDPVLNAALEHLRRGGK